MLKNFIKTAWRNLWKSRFYTSINIAGLAVSLAVAIIIMLWVNEERSYDRFHTNANTIYRLNAIIGTGASQQVWNTTQAPISTFGKKEVPEIKNAVRINPSDYYTLYSYGEKDLTKLSAAFIDPSFFTVFDFKLLTGNPKKPFPEMNSIVISATTAKKFFGNEDPIGKVIKADKETSYIVQGIVEDFPSNSSIQFDILFSMDLVAADYSPNSYWKSMEQDWGNYYFHTYIQLQPGSSVAAVEKKLTDIMHAHHDDAGNNHYTLQPLTKLHLYTADGGSSAMQTVRIFFIVAILLLVIASINYVNLSTARSMLRAKEVSVRKIVGAARLQLFLQFVVESAILFALAMLIAILLIYLLMPLYNSLSDKNTVFSLTDSKVWSTTGITLLSILVAASVYPAITLSSFKPLLALKGKITAGISNVLFRRVLVVTQFTFSVILIIGTLIIGRQLHYIQNKSLGYEKAHVFTLSMNAMSQHRDAVKAELEKSPGITGVSVTNGSIIQIGSATGDTDWDGKPADRDFLIHPLAIDEDLLPLMKMEFVAGENFTGNKKTDSAKVILNETAVQQAGIKDPIGKSFTLWNTKSTIIGVVKDFHFASLKEKIEPAIMYYRDNGWYMYVKTTGKDAPKAIAAVEKLWKQYNAGYPFSYNFMDETYDRMYKSDRRTGTLFNVFALIAILVSCLGLLGLATYTAQIKTKEIGIRKVLGASVAGLTGLLAKDFIKIVLIAILIASPIAWYLMHEWLKDFAYRVNIRWWIFPGAALIAIAIALLTVSYQSIKAALMNPVKALRTE